MGARLHFFICEHHRAELEAVIADSGYGDVSIVSFPAACGQSVSSWPAILDLLRSRDGDRTFILGGSCLASLPGSADIPGYVRHVSTGQCAAMFINPAFVDSLCGEGAYLMTPGWLLNWERQMGCWGFDRDTAGAFFRESARSLVLVDTGVSGAAGDALRAFSGHVGLPGRVIPAGLGYFTQFIRSIVLEWRLEIARADMERFLSNMNRENADRAMAHDLINILAGLSREDEAIGRVFEFCTVLFSPRRIHFISIASGRTATVHAAPPGEALDDAAIRSLVGMDGDRLVGDDGTGFAVRITHAGETLGVLHVDGVAFPEYRDHYLALALMIGGVLGLSIANARRYEDLRRLLDEKNVLMREIHHRVKNNMAMISGLLHIQELHLEDPRGKAALRECQNRIMSMQLIYDRLYRSEDLSHVDLQVFLRDLVATLFETYNVRPGSVQLALDIQPVNLKVRQAIPIGLLVNELVSNCFKYAFPAGRSGVVTVSLADAGNANESAGPRYRLIIADNGVGFPEGFEPERSTEFGLELVRMMVKQIRGSMSIARGDGVAFTIDFS